MNKPLYPFSAHTTTINDDSMNGSIVATTNVLARGKTAPKVPSSILTISSRENAYDLCQAGSKWYLSLNDITLLDAKEVTLGAQICSSLVRSNRNVLYSRGEESKIERYSDYEPLATLRFNQPNAKAADFHQGLWKTRLFEINNPSHEVSFFVVPLNPEKQFPPDTEAVLYYSLFRAGAPTGFRR